MNLSTQEPILTVKDLAISFSTWGKLTYALRGIHFTVNKGEILGIVGESGCGKSVTAKAIMRLLPTHSTHIDRGEILYREQNLLTLSEASMRRVRGGEIAMVFQDLMTSLNPTKKIGEQIVEGLLIHQPKLKKEKARAKAIELLDLVGIANPEERVKAYPHTLSGGMRQRAMIALAMACEPNILIADEPTTALDVTVQAQILTLLKDIAKTRNTSVLLITHDLSIVAGICDRVIVMYAGKIVEEGSTEQLFANPRHPYTRRLLDSIPRIDTPRGIPLIPIKGRPPTLQTHPKGCAFVPRCEDAMKICELQEPPMCSMNPTHHVACWKEKAARE